MFFTTEMNICECYENKSSLISGIQHVHVLIQTTTRYGHKQSHSTAATAFIVWSPGKLTLLNSSYLLFPFPLPFLCPSIRSCPITPPTCQSFTKQVRQRKSSKHSPWDSFLLFYQVPNTRHSFANSLRCSRLQLPYVTRSLPWTSSVAGNNAQSLF